MTTVDHPPAEPAPPEDDEADELPEADAGRSEAERWTPTRGHALLLAVGGAIGALASFVLTVEKVHLLEDPTYVPSCSINPVIGCGSVMSSDQAAALGFPNSLLGVVAFPVLVTLGVLALARVPLPRWVWVGLAAGSALGAAAVAWLVVQSLFRIGVLCPYCTVVWSVTVPVFLVTATWVWRTAAPGDRVARALYDWRSALVAAWFAGVVGIVLVRFWDYWSTLL